MKTLHAAAFLVDEFSIPRRGIYLALESQRQIPHHIEARHRDETDLVIAVVVRVTVAVADGRINPAAGGVTFIEDVVEVHFDDGFFDDLLWLQRIAKAHVRGAVGWKRTVKILGVVEIHP